MRSSAADVVVRSLCSGDGIPEVTRTVILVKSLVTSLPLSENHLEKSECAFTSTSCDCV